MEESKIKFTDGSSYEKERFIQSKQKTKDKRQKTKDKRQKTKDKRQKTKDKRQKTKDKRQKTKDKRQKTKDSYIKAINHKHKKTATCAVICSSWCAQRDSNSRPLSS